MLWYFKRSGNGNSQGPTMYSDIEDLIESQPADKTMHEWEQSTIEANHIIKPLTVEGQIVLDPFMGYGTNGMAALELNRKFIGIEIDKEHYSRGSLQVKQIQSFSFLTSMFDPIPVLRNCGSGPSFGFKSFRMASKISLISCNLSSWVRSAHSFANMPAFLKYLYTDEFGEKIIDDPNLARRSKALAET